MKKGGFTNLKKESTQSAPQKPPYSRDKILRSSNGDEIGG
jgi:hypothetical protein